MLVLELLDAGAGDAMVVAHLDAGGTKRIGVLDGGTKGRYQAVIKPAIAAHGISSDPNSPSLRWVAVTHIDSDHIGGIVKLLADDVKSDAVFFNTPDAFPNSGVVAASAGSPEAMFRTSIEANLSRLLATGSRSHVPAAIPEGNELLGMISSDQHNRPLHRRMSLGDLVEIDGLSLRVVAPSLERIEALMNHWESARKNAGLDEIVPASAKAMDNSVTNLSSFVFLLTYKRFTALLTGDALEDDILNGLTQLDLLSTAETLRVDVLKLPHHGSNSAGNPQMVRSGEGLLERVLADHYVISANGKDTNPSHEVLERLVKVNSNRPCTVWLPSPLGEGDSSSAAHYRGAVRYLRSLVEAEAAPMKIELAVADQGPLVLELEP